MQNGSLILTECVQIAHVNLKAAESIQISIKLVALQLKMLQSSYLGPERLNLAGLLCCSLEYSVLVLQKGNFGLFLCYKPLCQGEFLLRVF
jgi:hypothetical protein